MILDKELKFVNSVAKFWKLNDKFNEKLINTCDISKNKHLRAKKCDFEKLIFEKIDSVCTNILNKFEILNQILSAFSKKNYEFEDHHEKLDTSFSLNTKYSINR